MTMAVQRCRSPVAGWSLRTLAGTRLSSRLCVPPSRWLSSSANTARDTRLAGRRRFYLDVGIQRVAPPWAAPKETPTSTVDSGVSAGVDGSPSASGISSSLEMNRDILQRALVPRRPGRTPDPNVSVVSDANPDSPWYSVTLDGRVLRTPMGRTLAVPSRLLAVALAAEWNAVETTLNPTQMPFMTLVCTVLDQVSQPQVQEHVRNDCMNYLSTDTVCYLADPLQDRLLHRQQTAHWTPVHQFVAREFQAEAATLHGTQEAILSAVHRQLPHPEGLVEQCRSLLRGLDAWHLQCLYSVCRESKSLLLGLAVLLDHYQESSLQAAVDAARVEEEFQIGCWGLVEGQHDYDRLNCAVQIQSAVVLKDCLAMDCFHQEGVE